MFGRAKQVVGFETGVLWNFWNSVFSFAAVSHDSDNVTRYDSATTVSLLEILFIRY